jgi:hypothetical protein
MSQVELVLLQVLKLDKDLGRIFTLDMAAPASLSMSTWKTTFSKNFIKLTKLYFIMLSN